MAFDGVVTADPLVEPSFGLFSVAEVEKHGARDEHWISGYSVESEACGSKIEGQPLCTATDSTKYTIQDGSNGAAYFHVAPFDIIDTYTCDNSIGFNAVDRRAAIVRHLDRISEYAVERELWIGTAAQVDGVTGEAPADRWLSAAVDVTPTPGTAVKAALAVALVEQNFAVNNPGVQATIHVTPLLAAILRKSYFFEKGDHLVTANGSLVSISRGGVGTVGPAAGGTATKHWIYATGPVHVDLGSEELISVSPGEIVNPSNNEVAYVANRPAAVYFDGCSWYGALADATL